MKITNDTRLDFQDVLLVPHRTKTASRKNVKVSRYFKFYHSPREWCGTPIIAANMDTTGTLSMSLVLKTFGMITCLHKHYDSEELATFFSNSYMDMKTTVPIENCWFSMGIKDSDIKKLREVVAFSKVCPNICIDVANGYTDDFVNFCSQIREEFCDAIIMAGNVCTPEMVQELILQGGVDIVKIGIGPGSACTTRLKTGVGFPQLSAIIDCSHAAHGLKSCEQRLGLICADGGCRTPADVCKAFSANADFVMLGGMLAGTDECEGDWECVGDKRFLKFHGMSSQEAQDKHGLGLKDYRSSEGRVLRIPHKGPVADTVQDILGGIRSCCAYIGATSIKDMAKCAEFIRVNRTHFDQSV